MYKGPRQHSKRGVRCKNWCISVGNSNTVKAV